MTNSHTLLLDKKGIAPPGGLEPPTFRLTAERASRLRHGGISEVKKAFLERKKLFFIKLNFVSIWTFLEQWYYGRSKYNQTMVAYYSCQLKTLWETQNLFSPGIEPGTFCVLDRCDNRYTTKTCWEPTHASPLLPGQFWRVRKEEGEETAAQGVALRGKGQGQLGARSSECLGKAEAREAAAVIV